MVSVSKNSRDRSEKKQPERATSRATRTERMQHLLCLAAVILACGVVFANTFQNAFIWDDADLIVKNRYIKSLKNIPLLFTPQYWNHYQQTSAKGQYRPVRTTTFAIDYALWELEVEGYHLTNLLLHSSNALLVYFLVLQLLGPSSDKQKSSNQTAGRFSVLNVAFVTAMLFASHPIHVESVTWIKNRSDLLTLFFYLLSLLLFMRTMRTRERGGICITYALSLICFAGSLLSKEMAASLPLVLILYALCFLPQAQWKKTVIRILPFFGIVLLYILFKVAYLGMLVSDENAGQISLYSNLLAVIKTFGYYFRLLVFPFDLNAERCFAIPETLWEPAVVSSLVLLAAVFVIAIKAFPNSKALVFAIVWFFLTLLPASNIVFLSGRPIAEQRLYIPSLGFCVIIALGFRALACLNTRHVSRNTLTALATVCFVVIAILYGVTAINRNADWLDPLTLWAKTVEASPHSHRAHNNLGVALERRGRVKEAVGHFTEALHLKPDYAEASNNLGSALEREGKLNEATHFFSEAVRRKPGFAEARNNLGSVLERQGRFEEALSQFSEALRIKPGFAEVHNNLGCALERQGRIPEAIKHYTEALQLEPGFAEAHNNLGSVLEYQGSSEEALRHFSEALRINPAYAEAHYNSGVVLLRKGKTKEALQHFSEALRINPAYAEAHYNIGVILFRQQKLEEALSRFSEAVRYNPTYAEAHYNMGLILFGQQNIGEAIEHFSEVARIEPDHARAHYSLGIIMDRQGKLKEAIYHLSETVRIRPDAADAHLSLGIILERQGKVEEAISHYNEALRINPDFRKARKKLEALSQELGKGRENLSPTAGGL